MRTRLILIGALGVLIFAIVSLGQFISSNAGSLILLLKSSDKDIVAIIEAPDMSPFRLPEGFSVDVFAKGLDAPRVMIRDTSGNMLVSLTKEGKVVALPDRNQDGKADEVVTVIENLKRPHGLATYCFPADSFGIEFDCKLFIAEEDQVAQFDYDDENLKATNKKTILSLPSGRGHNTRTILFVSTRNGEKLLVSIGSSCNVCNERDATRATILSVDANGDNLETYATGLRNAVFMSVHPTTGELWVSEMGRDFLGDDLPPDEINIVRKGKNYGWPVCYGKNIHDISFDKNTYVRAPCSEPFEEPSYIDIPAHSAPLGLAFVPEEGWPEEYWYNLFVSYHGSWNRSEPTGYKIVRFILNEEGVHTGTEDFMTGFITEGNEILGRPAGLMVESQGVMYISDDRAGAIYRVTYDIETE